MIAPGLHRRAAFLPPDAMRALQDELLQAHVAHCLAHSPFYRERLKGSGLRPDAMTVERLAELPLTGKEDLARANDAFLAVPRRDVVDVVLSSGTTGLPTAVMYTEHDLQRLAYNEELAFAACGLTADDVVLLTCTLDRCFVAGLAYFLGVRRLGAAAIRNGHGTLESHLAVIRQLRPTAAVGVPSFLRKLGLYLGEAGLPAAESGIRKLVCIGEPVRGRDMEFVKLGADLEQIWGARVYSTYASTETVTTFCECTAQRGGHLHPDLGIVEIVDDDARPVAPGEAGEVVLTPLNAEAMPLLRFRTGDVSFLLNGECPCGRRAPRLGPIVGRKQQMMKVRGTSLYPQAVYAALDELAGVSEYYVEITAHDRLSDELTVHVAVADPALTAAALAERLQGRLRVKPAVVVEPLDAVRGLVHTPQSRKPVRCVDRRDRRDGAGGQGSGRQQAREERR